MPLAAYLSHAQVYVLMGSTRMTRPMQWRVDVSNWKTNAESIMNELHIYIVKVRFMNETSMHVYMGLCKYENFIEHNSSGAFFCALAIISGRILTL